MSSITNYQSILPLAKMEALLPDAKKQFREASPFPHIVIDDFFNPDVVDQILEEFPSRDDIDWISFNDSYQLKLANENKKNIGPFTLSVLNSLNSATFITFLEELVGIPDLISDPTFNGGGLHNICRGGKLEVHIDFNKHHKNNLDRRVNLLLYLNRNWKEEYEGNLELWDLEMQNCAKKVLPIFNRLVVFNTTETSFHGHPQPLKCPEDRSRKSLALYYYTEGKNENAASKTHCTLFQTRPGEKKVPLFKLKAQRLIHRISKILKHMRMK